LATRLLAHVLLGEDVDVWPVRPTTESWSRVINGVPMLTAMTTRRPLPDEVDRRVVDHPAVAQQPARFRREHAEVDMWRIAS
jgi:hypothetical protein